MAGKVNTRAMHPPDAPFVAPSRLVSRPPAAPISMVDDNAPGGPSSSSERPPRTTPRLLVASSQGSNGVDNMFNDHHPASQRGGGAMESDESFWNQNREEDVSEMEMEPASQFAFSQTQRSTHPDDDEPNSFDVQSSQVNPRRKYWAVFAPISTNLEAIKLHWPTALQPHPFMADGKPDLSLNATLTGICGFARWGRAPAPSLNDVQFSHRKISNKHCRIDRMDGGGASSMAGTTVPGMARGIISDDEPVVAITDLGSSNGTFVNGKKLTPNKRHILKHADEISLGGAAASDDHDVRFIFRSVGKEGEQKEKIGGIFERYHFREGLGAGSFAEVKKAIEIETGIVRAVKCITKHKFASNPKNMRLFKREIEIMESLHHDNIVELIEVFEDPHSIYLVLEYVDGGDLLAYIMNREPALSESESIDLTRQICHAMLYSHELGVAHRDLKPENILLTADKPPKVKVADFGLAKMVQDGTFLKTMVGTPQYLAPEVVLQTEAKPGYEMVVDSWSIGVITYCMMTNAMPFDEDTAQPVHVRISSRQNQPWEVETLRQIGVSENAIDFISRLLEVDPAKRMTVHQALEHPWLRIDSGPFGHTLSLGPSRSLVAQDSFSDFRSRASTAYDADLSTRSLSFNGLPIETGESMEDCSYPLKRLRLQTSNRRGTDSPPSARTARHTDVHSVDSDPESPVRKPYQVVLENASLSTPVPDSVPETQGIADSLASTNKRKLLEQSSSELSSLPESDTAASLARVSAQVPPRISEEPPKKRQTRASSRAHSTPPKTRAAPPQRTSTRLRAKKTGT